MNIREIHDEYIEIEPTEDDIKLLSATAQCAMVRYAFLIELTDDDRSICDPYGRLWTSCVDANRLSVIDGATFNMEFYEPMFAEDCLLWAERIDERVASGPLEDYADEWRAAEQYVRNERDIHRVQPNTAPPHRRDR